jgi:DNA-directed RNA polymerase specialized sigma24 family protein
MREPNFPTRLIVNSMLGVQMMASDDGVVVFESVRPRLFGIAYRMLGSAAEAEDIVQDAWLRWQGTDRSAVLDPPAFLATATTRLAITFAQSASKDWLSSSASQLALRAPKTSADDACLCSIVVCY